MRFQSKHTPDEIAEIRKIVASAASHGRSKREAYELAAAAYDSTPQGIRCMLARVDGRWSEGKATKADKGRIHVVIGDTQVKPGVPLRHLTWIGQYIAEQFAGQNVAVIHLGDHWDMPSLSSYDRGKRSSEGRRYKEDIEVGNAAFRMLHEPIAAARAAKKWAPDLHVLFGNHEDRITRACEDAAFLDGKLSLDDLDTCGWQRHAFRTPVNIDGIRYCHYFYHKNTGRPYSGDNLYPRLKTIGHSFTMGHQQGVQYTMREVDGKRHHGLVLGSTYLHDEEYLGPQAVAYWRGIVVKHQVEDGQYDPMFVSLDYLCRRYEGVTLREYLAKLPRS